MEHIVRESTYPELKDYPPRLRLSPFLFVVLIVLIGFAVVNMSVRAAAQYAVPPSNPFPAYAAVFPGQPVNAVEARAFSCQSEYNYYDSPDQRHDPTEETCVLTLAVGIFSSVEVKILQGVIRRTTFTLRDNTLQVGDLAKFLEMPTIHAFYRVGYFFLPNNFIIAETTSYTGQFSLFLPVRSVSFTDIKFLI